jgi:hypothetical protein
MRRGRPAAPAALGKEIFLVALTGTSARITSVRLASGSMPI